MSTLSWTAWKPTYTRCVPCDRIVDTSSSVVRIDHLLEAEALQRSYTVLHVPSPAGQLDIIQHAEEAAHVML